MEFLYKNNTITISSEKKNIVLSDNHVDLDGLQIECAGEYEKSGFLMYVREDQKIHYYMFRVEGFWIGYIPEIPTEIDAKIFDFFGQLDVLVAPFSKTEQKFLEQIEPKMLVTFAPTGSDLVAVLGAEIASGNNYKLKNQDISQDKTSLVILQ